MRSFHEESLERIEAMRLNSDLQSDARAFTLRSIQAKYSYNFSWLGRPIIQYPQDVVAMQQLVWALRPDLIIETGIAHGGSLMLSASLLALLDYCDACESGAPVDTSAPRRRVVGIDIDIREHNRKAIESHPLASRIDMIQGSSIADDVVERVRELARGHQRIMVCLDSNHSHSHVLAELEAYAPLVSSGSYCIVYDTVVENLPAGLYPDRPWDVGDNPMTAVGEFLASHPEFEVDREMDSRLLITVAPGGYLRRR